MQKTLFTLLLSIFAFTILVNAQYNSRSNNPNIKNTPVSYTPTEAAIFADDMNGNNTLAGIQARGWVFDDVDGAGLTTVFQGNALSVFPAYEGPDTGYVGQNFNGAFNGGFVIDQWLISPAITVNAGDTLKFWHRSPDGSTWADPLQVWVSTTAGTSHSDFDVQLAAFNGSTAGWAQYVGNFTTSGTVRFAVRYYTTTGGPNGTTSDYVGMDLFEVVSGASVSGSVILAEEFNYGSVDDPDITALTSNWVRHSGAQGPAYSSSSLTYAGYPSLEAIGGSISFTNGGSGTNDGDVNRSFDSITTSQNVYISFLVELASAKATADYFFHIGQKSIATIFKARVFARSNDTGWSLGLSKSSDTRTDDNTVLNFNQTYLIILKYEFNTAAADDDQVTLYLYNSGVPAVEPGSPLVTIGPVGLGTGGDITNVGSVAIRQGTNSPTGKVDGIRVATTWESVVPVELTSFAASVNGNSVNLAWSTATEINNLGFKIERKSSASDWTTIGFVSGSGTTSEVKNYSYSDNGLTEGKYSYRLKQVDFDGTFEYSKVVEAEIASPDKFELSQNYPNPFNPTTSIKFSLPEAGNVKLAVYNLLGQEVKTLVNGFRAAGTYTVNFDAQNLSSGLYIYKIETNNFIQTRKMTLLK